MPKISLSGMTVEALMDLRKRVDETLVERRAKLQQQLERMAVVGGARVVRGGGSPCLPFETPKLLATAIVNEGSFAELLDRRLKRMAEMKLIEAQPTPTADDADNGNAGSKPEPTPAPLARTNDRRFRRY